MVFLFFDFQSYNAILVKTFSMGLTLWHLVPQFHNVAVEMMSVFFSIAPRKRDQLSVKQGK